MYAINNEMIEQVNDQVTETLFNQYEQDQKILDYVLFILNDSRTKKQAIARLTGLMSHRQELLEKINDYKKEKLKEK